MTSAADLAQREDFIQDATVFLKERSCQGLVVMGMVVSKAEGVEHVQRDMVIFPRSGHERMFLLLAKTTHLFIRILFPSRNSLGAWTLDGLFELTRGPSRTLNLSLYVASGITEIRTQSLRQLTQTLIVCLLSKASRIESSL